MSKKKRLGHFPFGPDSEDQSDYDFIPDIKEVEESRSRALENDEDSSSKRKSMGEILYVEPEDSEPDDLAVTEEFSVSGNFRKSLVNKFQALSDFVKG